METPKFKIGDRVRTNFSNPALYDKGETGTISDLSPEESDFMHAVKLDAPDPRREKYGDVIFITSDRLEPIEAAPIPSLKHTTYTPEGVTISMELEWEIARLLGMAQVLSGEDAPLLKQCEKVNQMWMGK